MPVSEVSARDASPRIADALKMPRDMASICRAFETGTCWPFRQRETVASDTPNAAAALVPLPIHRRKSTNEVFMEPVSYAPRKFDATTFFVSRNFDMLGAFAGHERCTSLCQSRAMSTSLPNLPIAILAYSGGDRGKQKKLADAIGVSEASVTRWVQGEEPKMQKLQRLAKELGVTVAYLAGEEEAAQTQDDLNLLRRWWAATDRERRMVDLALPPLPVDASQKQPD